MKKGKEEEILTKKIRKQINLSKITINDKDKCLLNNKNRDL